MSARHEVAPVWRYDHLSYEVVCSQGCHLGTTTWQVDPALADARAKAHALAIRLIHGEDAAVVTAAVAR